MSHEVQVHLIANATIMLRGRAFSIHDIKSIMVDDDCTITDVYLEPEPPEEPYTGWLSEERK